ncbi:MAG: response regulator [Candidatus Hydrogenedentes bacterium]|nr:response regulator [Candidatus Hydrogenedentota bacterium]
MLQVLVADDEITTRIGLKALLERSGYSVVLALNGDAAWEVLSDDVPPQIALLDWEMPGLLGPEICRRLATRSNGPFVYTILLTGRTDDGDLVNGFDSGANDFMCKPFNALELKSRIGAAARIVQYERELHDKNVTLAEYATEMERLAEDRARQLVHSDRMATLGTLAAGMAHEINNPASFISGNLQTLELFWKDVGDALSRSECVAGDSKLLFIQEEMPKLIAEMRSGVSRISRIVNSLRSYSHAGAKTTDNLVAINTCVDDALLLCRNNLKHNVVTNCELDPDLPKVTGDCTQITQVLVNLITNAVHAMEPAGGTIHIESKVNDKDVVVTVRDSGQGIPEDSLEKIWLPFFTTKQVGKGTGLGLPICQRIIEEHGGSIGAENHLGGGALFTITLPLPKESRYETSPTHR